MDRDISFKEVFNGPFYNLDVMLETAYKYNNPEEIYDFYEELGEGGFSTCYRAYFKPTGEELAVKILKAEKSFKSVIETFKQEALVLSKLDHDNVIKVKHLILLDGKYYMGMEFLPGGSLSGILKSKFTKKEKLTDIEASSLMRGILRGTAYIHQKDIMHRDMKPQNMLIKDLDDMSTVQLIDFGLGQIHKNSTHTNDEYCGTLTFMAPEMINAGYNYTRSVDIWAIGIIMHMVLTGGKHPIFV